MSVAPSELNWSGQRVLVTGATGMIGAWLVKELIGRGAYVVAFVLDADPQSELLRSGDIQRVSVVNGDLRDLSAVARAVTLHETDTVFHLGAQTIVGVAHRDPYHTLESNIRGTYNLLEVCRQHRDVVRRVIVASSDKAYGEHDRLPYTEESALLGRHPYEVSKTCADLIAQAYHHTYGLPLAIARMGNVYGGGDLNWSRIVPGTIRSLSRGERPIIRSDGLFKRDYLYVKDTVRAYLRLAECMDRPHVSGEAFNFSPERPLSVLQIVAELQRLMNRSNLAPEILNTATGEIKDQYLSAAKARDRLGWSCGYSLEAGLRETIAWYQALFA